MTADNKGGRAVEDAQPQAGVGAHEDSPKRQGDKLERVTGAGGSAGEAGGTGSGDSPKPHGDTLEHARDEAAGGSGEG